MGATTGSGNIAIGELALSVDAGGSSNIAIGHWALSSIDHLGYNGQRNIAIGISAMVHAWAGEDNVALGNQAMGGADWDFGNRGSRNTAIGTRVLIGNYSGNDNTAVGYEALYGYTDTGGGPGTQDGSNNTALGMRTLRNNSHGSGNTAAGFESLFSNYSGSNNTATGNRALRGLTTGARNVALGNRAGLALTTGSDNIVIGADNTGLAGDAGVIRIGRSPSQSKTYIAGIRGVKTGSTSASAVFIDVNGQLGTIKSSGRYKEDIQPMASVSERLFALRPVTFRYKEPSDDGSKPVQFGLIAEEVAEAFPELVVYDEEGKPETVSYHLLATLLLNEYQKEHTRIAELEQQSVELAQLKKQVAMMAEVIERLDHERMVATNR